MVKKLILILAAHSCGRNDSSCCWNKRSVDHLPPKVEHGFQKDDGTTQVFYADVFDRSRIAEVMGIALPKPGRPKKARRLSGKFSYLDGNGRRVSVHATTLRDLRPSDVIWPEGMDPELKAGIVASMKKG